MPYEDRNVSTMASSAQTVLEPYVLTAEDVRGFDPLLSNLKIEVGA